MELAVSAHKTGRDGAGVVDCGVELAVSAHKTGRKHARTSAGTQALLREHISFLMSHDHPTADETGDLVGVSAWTQEAT